MFRSIETISALMAILLGTVSAARAQECSRLQGASPGELTSYLDEPYAPLRLNPAPHSPSSSLPASPTSMPFLR